MKINIYRFQVRASGFEWHNYAIWWKDMETLLKSKALQQFTKTVIPDPKGDQYKFNIDGKKD